MGIGKKLYELQRIDLDLRAKSEILRRVEGELTNNLALAKAREELRKEQEKLAQLKKRQREEEWVFDDLQAKLAPLEKELYEGSVKNPKELLSLGKEVESLKASVKKKEEEILEIMSQVELVEKGRALKAEVVVQLEKEWEKRQRQLLVEQAELKIALERGEQERRELISTLSPASLELYETLKIKKQGQAVAKIEQGRCQGCRITLPLSEMQRARSGELVLCSTCGRILYLG